MSCEKAENNAPTIKVYKRRWVILTIFVLYSAISAFQWIEYPIITNIVMRYYNVSTVAVDWTSIIYMALYPPLVIPASYIIDKKVRTPLQYQQSSLPFDAGAQSGCPDRRPGNRFGDDSEGLLRCPRSVLGGHVVSDDRFRVTNGDRQSAHQIGRGVVPTRRGNCACYLL